LAVLRLNPARFAVEKKGKTVKEAIELTK